MQMQGMPGSHIITIIMHVTTATVCCGTLQSVIELYSCLQGDQDMHMPQGADLSVVYVRVLLLAAGTNI